MSRRISEFKDLYPGQIAYVVGKGPSLQWLESKHIGEGPVITINEAIGKVESLNLGNDVYSFFKDGCKVYDETPESYFKRPHLCQMPLSSKNAPTFVQDFEAPFCFKDYPNRVGFNNQEDFGIAWFLPSAPTIISFAKHLGCRKIVWLCMDSFVNGDISSFSSNATGDCQYLNRQSSYYQHRVMVYGELNRLGMEHEWIIPERTNLPESNKIKLLIATPFYPFFGYSGYIRSLFQLAVMLGKVPQVEFNFLELSGHCYVDNVRNTIASKFLQSDYTDLLFYDSDMEVDIEGFASLISSQEEIVGAVYRMKNNWEAYNGNIITNSDGTPVVNENGLIKASNLPTGLMKIKRTALEKMAQHYVDEFYYDRKVTDNGETLAPVLIHNFFGNIISKEFRTYYGEDTSFCIRWREMGGELWIEPRVTIKHYGLKSYEGNFHEYLTRLPGGSKTFQTRMEEVWDKGNYRQGSAGERYARRFVQYVPDGAIVNDYGSGSGRGTVAIKKLRPDLKINMVDFARNALEPEAMAIIGTDVTFVLSDLSRLPDNFPIADWGYCIGVMMLMEEEEIDNAIREISRTCKNLFFEVYDFADFRLGVDMTRTKKPAEWWADKFRKHWNHITLVHGMAEPGRHVLVCEEKLGTHFHKTLNAIFMEHGSDKGYQGNGYGDFYEEKLSLFKDRNIRFLEIGLSCDGTWRAPSLTAWQEFLPKAHIVGLDIRDFKSLAQPGIDIEMVDQGNAAQLVEVAREYQFFDVIVDDGSHQPSDQIVSFEVLFPYLLRGGLYVIEDLLEGRNDPLIEYLDNHGFKPEYFQGSSRQRLLCITKE